MGDERRDDGDQRRADVYSSARIGAAAALTAAGVEATLQEFAHRWHVFHLNAGLLADANRALAAAGAFVRSHARSVSIGGQ